MTEFEKIVYAKEFIDKPANGIILNSNIRSVSYEK